MGRAKGTMLTNQDVEGMMDALGVPCPDLSPASAEDQTSIVPKPPPKPGMKSGFLLMPGEEATVIDPDAWRKSIEGLTEEEIKWKSWLATRGHDVTITESNVADYCEVTHAGEQAEMRRPQATGLNEFYEEAPLPENPCPEWGCELEFETPFLLRRHIKADHPPTFPPPAIECWDAREIEDGMGAKYQTYSWRQDTSHVMLRVPVPRGTKAADIVVKLKKQHLYIALSGGQVLINSKT